MGRVVAKKWSAESRRDIMFVVFVVYALAAVMLGGASQEGYFQRSLLNVVSVLVLFWCVLDPALKPMSSAAKWGVGFILAFMGLGALQLVPLPAAIWSGLPDRGIVAEGYRLAGEALPSLPFSLAPYATLEAILSMLAPLAVFILVSKLSWQRLSAFLPVTILAFGVISIVIGLMQVFDGADSAFYLYERTTPGMPVGVFANTNHHATLLLVCLPFVAALAAKQRNQSNSGDADLGQTLIIALAFTLLVFGVMIVGSGAGYALLLPVLGGCFLVFARGMSGKTMLPLVLFGAAVMVVLAVNTALSPVLSELGFSTLTDGPTSRTGMWELTMEAIRNHWMLGTGLGSFPDVVRLYEDPALVTNVYVNHAHNDYLELLLEFGLPGAALLIGGLAFLARLIGLAWRVPTGEGGRMKRAASVAILVIALHSLVDYPLRTTSISVLAAVCLAIVATSHTARRRRSTDRKSVV